MLTMRQLLQVAILQGEAREIGPHTDECRSHVLRRTAEMLHIAAGCMVLSHDAAPGQAGRIGGGATYNFDAVTRPAFDALVERGTAFHPVVAEMFRRHTRDPNAVAVESVRTVLSTREWHECAYYCDYVRRAGLDQVMGSIHGTGQPGVVHGFGLFRERGGRPFDRADETLLHVIQLAIGPYVCWPTLDRPEPRLTPRERDVLVLLCDGSSDKEIAASLGISPHTVSQRVKRIYRAFGVHSRAQLIARMARASAADRK